MFLYKDIIRIGDIVKSLIKIRDNMIKSIIVVRDINNKEIKEDSIWNAKVSVEK